MNRAGWIHFENRPLCRSFRVILVTISFLLCAGSVASARNLFVTDFESGKVREFKESTGEYVGKSLDTGTSGPGFRFLTFHPLTGHVYVSDSGDFLGANPSASADWVNKFDGETGQFIGVFGQTDTSLKGPRGLKFHPISGSLLVVDVDTPGQGEVREFDGDTGTFTGTFGQTAQYLGDPEFIAIHPVTGHLFFSDRSQAVGVREFDAGTGELIGGFGDTKFNTFIARGMAFHPVTHNLFVADSAFGDIREFDGTTGEFIGVFGETRFFLDRPVGVAFNPLTHNLFVTDMGFSDVREFQGTNGKFLGVFGATGEHLQSPYDLAFRPSDNNPVVLDPEIFNRPRGERVVAPYWQADSVSYTFIAVTHPSLTGMNSQIGVQINAVLDNSLQMYAPTLQFTVASGELRRIFIRTADNPGITPEAVPDALFITGTTGSSKGQLVINPNATDPAIQPGTMATSGRGAPDITQLNFWGAVVVQSSATGFAMEFIGDINDSRAFNTPNASGVN